MQFNGDLEHYDESNSRVPDGLIATDYLRNSSRCPLPAAAPHFCPLAMAQPRVYFFPMQ